MGRRVERAGTERGRGSNASAGGVRKKACPGVQRRMVFADFRNYRRRVADYRGRGGVETPGRSGQGTWKPGISRDHDDPYPPVA